MSQLIRLRDFEFLLHDVLQVSDLCETDLFSDHSRDVFDAILETAKKLAEDKFEDHAALIDHHPPRLTDNGVEVPPDSELCSSVRLTSIMRPQACVSISMVEFYLR